MGLPEGHGDLAVDFYVAFVRVVRELRRDVPGEELSAGAVSALFAVARTGPMRATALAEHEGVAAASMTRIVNSLEEHGYVRRTSDPADGRAQVVTPTEAGERLVREGTAARIDAVRRRLEALSEADRSVIADALPALARFVGQ
jgi:DNA-binding MarR family transcriptional regulator